MLDARRNDRKEEEWEAEVEMMKMFETQEDYLHALKVYEEYEKDKDEYLEYL